MAKEIIDLTADSEEEIQEIGPPAAASEVVLHKSKDKKKPSEEKRKKKRSKEKNAHRDNLQESGQRIHKDSGSRDQEDAPMFYIDEKPSILPNLPPPPTANHTQTTLPPSHPKDESSSKLLLPEHVKVFGSTPFEIIVPPEQDEDFIDYLDYDPSSRKVRRVQFQTLVAQIFVECTALL